MPGNGKTTYAVVFADYFGKEHGKTLYCPAEQAGANKDFQNLLNRLGIRASFDIQKNANVLTENDIIGLVQARGYKLIVLDSVNKMRITPEGIGKIRQACPELAILSIMQSTKDGNFKGSQEYKHDCDIYLNVENFVVYQSKARSAGAAKMAIDELIVS